MEIISLDNDLDFCYYKALATVVEVYGYEHYLLKIKKGNRVFVDIPYSFFKYTQKASPLRTINYALITPQSAENNQ